MCKCIVGVCFRFAGSPMLCEWPAICDLANLGSIQRSAVHMEVPAPEPGASLGLQPHSASDCLRARIHSSLLHEKSHPER